MAIIELTQSDLARHLNMHRSTVSRRVSSGELPSGKSAGNTKRWPLTTLLERHVDEARAELVRVQNTAERMLNEFDNRHSVSMRDRDEVQQMFKRVAKLEMLIDDCTTVLREMR